uniref:T9SS type A sorting domain-containing protein n=1 Tax=candidate division WOR-3 bacterium TaxID=2052148 RepID=A0A7C4GH25_UNCW3
MAARASVLLVLLAVPASAASWDTILPLTDNPQNQSLGYGYQRSVAVDPVGNVHVVWLDQRTTPNQLWHRRFDRAAGSWLPETMLTNRSASCSPPGVACDAQGNVHVIWHLAAYPYGIWYKRFDAGTGRWQPDFLLDSATTELQKLFPSVACRPGSRVVHVAWYGHSGSSVYYSVFHREFKPDSGWRRTEQVSTEDVQRDQASLAADSAGNICVVWCGYDSGGAYPQVVCRRRVNGVWQPVEIVSDMPDRATQFAPCVAAGPGGVWHFVWHGRTSQEMFQHVRYRNRSLSGWTDIAVVSDLPDRQQESPSIWCRRGGDCHVVWRGQSRSSNVYQLFYARREPNGFWTTPVQLTQRSSGNVSRPAITADSDTCLHAVWHDASSGDQDVYYLRGHERGTWLTEAPSCPNSAVSLLPNPVAGRFCRILCPEGSLIRVSDASGRVLIAAAAGPEFTLDCRGLDSGVYFVEVEYGARAEVRKLVKPSP